MERRLGRLLFLLVPLLMLLAGCGGGGGGGASTVSGVAATGAPLVGTVYLKDSSTPAKELSGTIDADGSFSFNIDGLKPPFILKAQGTVGSTNYTLYSFSSGPGIVNINPFANLAVANAAGSADLASLYATPTAATMQSIAANLAKAVTDIQTKLQPLLTPYSATANPISGSYTTNHLGLDGVLDMVKVDISATGTVTLTNKLTSAVIYTGSVTNFTSGILTTANIPQPPVVVTITPITAAVQTNGTAAFTASAFNSTNNQVTWSVVESGGGTITSAGVYTAPSAEGTYHVKAVSVVDPTKSAIVAIVVTATGTGTLNSAIYKALTPASSSSAFITQANAEGVNGYRYLNDIYSNGSIASIYVKDNSQSSTFSYKVMTPASSSSDFINQANAEGANGYSYLSDHYFNGSVSTIYVKNNSQSSTFSYKTLTPASSSSDFINQTNAEGANGYRYLCDIYFNGSIASIYVKDNSQSSSFSYKALTPASSSSDFLTQANAEGANGYRYLNDTYFNGSIASIYVKDISQSSTFSYEALPASFSSDFLTQVNAEGAKGYRYLHDYYFNGSISTIYIDLTKSNGILSSSYLSQGGIPY